MSSTTEARSMKNIGDSDVQLNQSELHERLKRVLSDPHSLIIFPNYRDYDRNLKYDMPALARWTGSTPTKQRIYTKRDRVFVFARHVTFHDLNECHPNLQRAKIAATYALARTNRTIPPFHVLSYHTQYGKSSFWTVAHLKDSITDKYFGHSVSMYVMINGETRRPQPVISKIKQICDANWKREYPADMKPKYESLKRGLSNDLTVLNALNKNVEYRSNDKIQPLFTYPIQMRYMDEDQNHHMNTNTYVAFAVEALNHFDGALRRNQKVICSMSNIYWKEIRMRHFEYCYVNIWSAKYTKIDGHLVQLYVGTVDIDESVCKRAEDGTSRGNDVFNNRQPNWTHYNGFIAGAVAVDSLQASL